MWHPCPPADSGLGLGPAVPPVATWPAQDAGAHWDHCDSRATLFTVVMMLSSDRKRELESLLQVLWIISCAFFLHGSGKICLLWYSPVGELEMESRVKNVFFKPVNILYGEDCKSHVESGPVLLSGSVFSCSA